MTYALLAQDPAGTPAPAGGKPADVPFFANPLYMMALFGLFILFMVVLPGRRQRKEQQLMLANVKRGAKVVTNAGIIGTVVNVKDTEDEVTLRSEDTKIRVLKSSIARVLGQDENEAK